MFKDINFVQLAQSQSNSRKRMRYLALAHFQDGMNRAAIAKSLKVSRTSVNKWVSNFLQYGLKGLDDTPSPGRPPGLTLAQRERLSKFIEQQSHSEVGGRLQGTDIQRYIEDTFKISYEISNIYRLLRELGFSWITSRSRHPKQSQAAQNEFKKTAN